MKPELLHLCKRKCDKQFGRNSASLFIFEFAFRQTSHYCMQFVNKLREKTFFGSLDFLQKVFMGE